jgi:2-haloacid dehalogenase
MLDLTRFAWLTFDCYGTLIDWESGMLRALRPVLGRHGQSLTDEEVLELYAELEARAEAGPYVRYREVLESVMAGMGKFLGFTPSPAELGALAASLPGWPPFADTVEALRRLKARYRLGIISNTDDDLFAQTARTLEVPFDAVITAEQARSYKPSPRNFELALERLEEPRERVLHVAQSLYHDHVPAQATGLRSVWVNRRAGMAGGGATRPATVQPDLEVPDLKSLADLVEKQAADQRGSEQKRR